MLKSRRRLGGIGGSIPSLLRFSPSRFAFSTLARSFAWLCFCRRADLFPAPLGDDGVSCCSLSSTLSSKLCLSRSSFCDSSLTSRQARKDSSARQQTMPSRIARCRSHTQARSQTAFLRSISLRWISSKRSGLRKSLNSVKDSSERCNERETLEGYQKRN